MTYEVQVAAFVTAKAVALFGEERSSEGQPSEWDLSSGPLQAALIAFRDFDSLLPAMGPAVRSFHFVDPVFGALVFVGVLLQSGIVEIADFEQDPDYWRLVQDDPDD